MKKWQKVLTVLVSVIVVLALGLWAFYQLYAKDKIEKTLEKAAVVLNDPKLQREVDSIAEEMLQQGELTPVQMQEYMEYQDAMQKETSSSASTKPSTAPTAKPASLIDRVKAAMTADEFAFAMSIYGKLDIGYVTGNLHSNRNGVKKYVKSVLSSDEISRSLTLYKKYSYLLN